MKGADDMPSPASCMQDEISILRRQLAEADAVVARNFPNAAPDRVHPDTLRCVERHRQREAWGSAA